jgi:hypothetical protein
VKRRGRKGKNDGRGSGWEVEGRKSSSHNSCENKEGGKEGKTGEGAVWR